MQKAMQGCSRRVERVRARRLVAMAALVAVAGGRFGAAAVIEWDGGPDGKGTLLNDPVNWVGDVLPGSGDDALLPLGAGSSRTVSLNDSWRVGSLTTTWDYFSLTASGGPGKVLMLGGGSGGLLLAADGTVLPRTRPLYEPEYLRIDSGVSILLLSAGDIRVSASARELAIYSPLKDNSGGGFTKTGDGTLWLKGVNSYGGPTISILPFAWGQSGTYSASTIGGFVTYDSNGIRLLNTSTEYATLSAAGPDRNVLTSSGSVAQPTEVNSLWFGGTLSGAGPLTVRSGAVIGSGTISVGELAFGDADGIIGVQGTISSRITGTADLIVRAGAGGTLTLRGDNTFGGPGKRLYVNDGTLSVASNAALGDPANTLVLNNGATLALGAFALSHPVVLAGGTAYIKGVAGSDVAASISGPGALDVPKTSLIRLSGTSTYTGGTTVWNGSTLVLGSDQALGTGALVLVSDVPYTYSPATLRAEGGARTIEVPVNLYSGQLTVAGANPLVFAGLVTLGGSLTLRSNTAPKLNIYGGAIRAAVPLQQSVNWIDVYGDFEIGGNADLTLYNLQLHNNVVLNVTNTGRTTAPISGSMTKTGPGILAVSSGTLLHWTVAQGVLELNGPLQAHWAGEPSLEIASSAELRGAGQIQGPVRGHGLISPGQRDGLLALNAIDPSNGLRIALEFTSAGAPAYDNRDASRNDILAFATTTPFLSPLGPHNRVDICFDVPALAPGDVFKGGIYVAGIEPSALLSQLQGADMAFWIADPQGPMLLNGRTYSSLDPALIDMGAVYENTGMRFWLTFPSTGSITTFRIVPEPAGGLTLAAAVLLALPRRRWRLAAIP